MHPTAAALEALVAHLGPLAPCPVKRGWPEADTEAELPEITIVAASAPSYDLGAPAVICYEDGIATIRYGWMSLRVQVDLWARSRRSRDLLAGTVEPLLVPGLWLTSAAGRPLNFDVAESELMDGANSAPDGIWRCRWALDCRTDLVVQRAVPALERLDIKAVTDAAITEIRTILAS